MNDETSGTAKTCKHYWEVRVSHGKLIQVCSKCRCFIETAETVTSTELSALRRLAEAAGKFLADSDVDEIELRKAHEAWKACK